MKKLILLLIALLMSLVGFTGEDTATAQESSIDPHLDQSARDDRSFFSDWNPNSEILRMHQKIQQLLRRTSLQTQDGFGVFKPSLGNAALKDMRTEYQLRLDWPRMDKNKIELTIAARRLRIAGEQRIKNQFQNKNSARTESSFRSVERVITLPDDADETGITANYKKDFLTIHIPKLNPKAFPQDSKRTVTIK